MRIFMRGIIIIDALLVSVGLARGADAQPQAQPQGQPESSKAQNDLTGRWMAGCHKVAVFHKRYGVETVTFAQSNQFSREIKEYQDSDCRESGLIDQRAFSGTYNLGHTVKGVPNAHEINFTIDSASVIALGDEAVREFNDTKTCGKVDWKTGLRRSTLGGDCPGQPVSAGTVIYDLVDQTSNQLFFGKSSYFRDGSSPDKRPAKVDYDTAFVRAEPMAAH